MEKKLILELNNHNVYYVKNDILNYYITIPKNMTTTNICIDLKNKMDNYNLELNDEIWVMENIKNTFSFIDNYNITLVLPVFNEEAVSILEKIDTTRYEEIDKLLGFLINNAYSNLIEVNLKIENQVILIDNDRYKTFINWFTARYRSRVTCQSLLELIRIFNVNATSYKKLETPGMTFVVGSYNTEIDAPRNEKPEVNTITAKVTSNPVPKTSSGFTSYWLLAVITLVVSAIVAYIAFKYK